MNFFGKKRTTNTPTPGTARSAAANNPTNTVITLRDSLSTLEKREDHLYKKMEEMQADAKKKMARKDKKGALFSLKRKKMFEAEIDKIQGSKMTLETQIMSLESNVQNMETYSAMKAGASAMANIRKQCDVENVDELMDDIREEMEIAQEISTAIAQPVDTLGTDEDELLDELKELEELDLEEKLLQVPASAAPLKMPNAPTTALEQEADDEAEALKALEASLA